jgi:hypothetical protein
VGVWLEDNGGCVFSVACLWREYLVTVHWLGALAWWDVNVFWYSYCMLARIQHEIVGLTLSGVYRYPYLNMAIRQAAR